MATRRLRKLRKPASARVRRKYAPDVLRLAAAWESTVRREYYRTLAQVLPRVREALIRQGARRDAVDTDELLRGLEASPAPEDLLRRLFNQVDDEGERKLRARLPGVSLPDVLRGGPRLQQQWVRANVDLIKVPDRIKSVLRKELAGPLDAGVRVEEVMKDLQAKFGLDARRAELIARDQTLKLSGQLQEERQLQAGIKRYVWTTSGDERVRHDHAELDGKVFEWDDPPITNASEVARGRPPRRNHPGGDFQCRCNSDPVLEESADADISLEPEPVQVEPVRLEVPSVSNSPAFEDVTPAQRGAPFTRPTAPELPLEVPPAFAPATPTQLRAQAESLDVGAGLSKRAAAPQVERAIAEALPGKSLEDLKAIPFTPAELQADTSLAFLRKDPVFAELGNVADNFGRSKGGLPQITIDAAGVAYLSNGRHRLTVARELGLRQIVARVRKFGPRGGVLWDFIGPVRI